MWIRNDRDTVPTKAFFKRLIRDYEQPRTIVTNQYAPSLKAVKELRESGILKGTDNHYKSKYLNNILEKAHSQVTVKLPYFDSLLSSKAAAVTIKGIKVVSALYKEK